MKYYVGPKEHYPNLQSVAPFLAPGDVVEVEGNNTYSGGISFNLSGTPDKPIIIRGIRVKGRRPILYNTISFGPVAVVQFLGSHYIFEGFEVTADEKMSGKRGIRNVGDNLTVRDCVVHNCGDGILGSDLSGSLTLQFVEVYDCGMPPGSHQIYIGSNNRMYPNAVFRMEFCYIHDAAYGSSVKSRVTRNEFYYNWIEGGYGGELDLFGADAYHQDPGLETTLREDSEIVGNVIIKHANSVGCVARLGSDGTGVSNGRYRFLNNTFIIDPRQPEYRPLFRLQDAIQTLEFHNNVVYRSGQPQRILSDVRLFKGATYKVSGANNWLPRGSTQIPPEWKGTIFGTEPGFLDFKEYDFQLRSDSPLRDAGILPTESPEGFPFPRPLERPLFHPPLRVNYATLQPLRRPYDGKIDIGAFEWLPEPTPAPRLPPISQRIFKHPEVARIYGEFQEPAEEGQLEHVKKMIASDPSLLAPGSEGRKALPLAAANGQIEMVKFFLDQGLDVDTPDWGNCTPLFSAAFRGHTETVKLLLARGAKVDARAGSGRTPLRHAAQFNRHPEVVRLLLDHGADVNGADNDGWTPLHAACAFGIIEIVQEILARRPDVNAANIVGLTPLHYAVIYRRPEVVRLLLAHGADRSLPSPEGKTPLQLARELELKEMVALLRNTQ